MYHERFAEQPNQPVDEGGDVHALEVQDPATQWDGAEGTAYDDVDADMLNSERVDSVEPGEFTPEEAAEVAGEAAPYTPSVLDFKSNGKEGYYERGMTLRITPDAPEELVETLRYASVIGGQAYRSGTERVYMADRFRYPDDERPLESYQGLRVPKGVHIGSPRQRQEWVESAEMRLAESFAALRDDRPEGAPALSGPVELGHDVTPVVLVGLLVIMKNYYRTYSPDEIQQAEQAWGEIREAYRYHERRQEVDDY